MNMLILILFCAFLPRATVSTASAASRQTVRAVGVVTAIDLDLNMNVGALSSRIIEKPGPPATMSGWLISVSIRLIKMGVRLQDQSISRVIYRDLVRHWL